MAGPAGHAHALPRPDEADQQPRRGHGRPPASARGRAGAAVAGGARPGVPPAAAGPRRPRRLASDRAMGARSSVSVTGRAALGRPALAGAARAGLPQPRHGEQLFTTERHVLTDARPLDDLVEQQPLAAE